MELFSIRIQRTFQLVSTFRGITWLSVMRIFYEICCELHKLKYRNYETARFKPYGNILRA